jgi:hypothetical protein
MRMLGRSPRRAGGSRDGAASPSCEDHDAASPGRTGPAGGLDCAGPRTGAAPVGEGRRIIMRHACIPTVVLATTLLWGPQAHAVSDVQLDNLQLTAYDASGAVDPTALAIRGSDRVDTEIPVTWIPCCDTPGPGPWNWWNGGVVTGSTPFTPIVSLGEIDDESGFTWGSDVAYVGQDLDTGLVLAEASASGGAPFQSYATTSSSGTFTLAPHARLVMTGTVEVVERNADGSATVTLGVDGGRQQTWIAPVNVDAPLDLTVTNPGDVAITGTFGFSLFASSVPEPAAFALVLGGLAAIGLTKKKALSVFR